MLQSSITDEQIQQIFDGHTSVFRYRYKFDPNVEQIEGGREGDESRWRRGVGGSRRATFWVVPPIIVENLGVPPLEPIPVVTENDADEAAPPKKKRKVARQRISYSKRKLLALGLQ
jgi:hypothetical protein